MARKETTEGQVINTEEAAAKPEPKSRGVFSKEQIAQIRELRAEKKEDGKPVHSHAALAAQFGTTAGVISHIVRNLSYRDEAYTPVNDMAGRKQPKEAPATEIPAVDGEVADGDVADGEAADGDVEAGEAAEQN